MTYRLHTYNYSQPVITKRIRKRAILSLLATILMLSGSVGILRAETTTTTITPPNLQITALQTGGCATGPASGCSEVTSMEYVEVYHTGNTMLTVSGWQLRYLSASGTPVVLATITGNITPHSYLLIGHAGHYPANADLTFGAPGDTGKIAKTGGHVEIVDSSGVTIDRLGWGSAQKPLTKAASAPSPGKILERRNNAAGSLLYSANNYADFAVTDAAAHTTLFGGLTPADTTAPVQPTEPPSQPDTTPLPTPPITPPEETQPQVPPAAQCDGIIISELLPNPGSSDAGKEFIELHNPTLEVIDLQGCSLQTSGSTSKLYTFESLAMQPGSFISLGDSTTLLTLPNSNGGTVWLLDGTDELQAITYPADMDDDTAWALVDGTWGITYTNTPNAANIATPLKPCDDPGQVRSADTGRCATPEDAEPSSAADASAAVTSASGLTACKAGQERNPQTNRCRAVQAGNSTTATACKAGQERNPETNRCRAVASATAPKACPAGQERNPETNRCRKIAATGSSSSSGIADVKDVEAASSTPERPYWLMAAVLALAIAGYAVYEWRQEIGQALQRLTSRFRKVQTV